MAANHGAISRLAPTTTRQHGLFTVAQASAAGVTKGVLDRRVRQGEIIPVDYGVYRSVLTPTTWHLQLLAACLAGPAVASHRSAATLSHIPVPDPGVLEVTALRHRRRRTDTVIWHESYLLDELSITEIDGIPVTRAGRTIIDLAGVLDADHFQRALDDVLRRRMASIESIAQMLEQMGPLRIGTATVRAALEARAGSSVPESDLETQFELLIRAHGLPAPVAQFPVTAPNGRRLRIDFAYPESMVGVELLGARFHAQPERWSADIERLGVLAALGWLMLSFSHDQIVQSPTTVLRAVEQALAR